MSVFLEHFCLKKVFVKLNEDAFDSLGTLRALHLVRA